MTKGLVLLLAGLPGAGKTTVADALGRMTGAVVIGRDRVRTGLFPVCTYSDEEKDLETRVILESLAINAALERDAIADGISFGESGLLEQARQQVEAVGGSCVAVWLQVDLEVAVKRVEDDRAARRHPAADRDAVLVRRVHATFRDMPNWVQRVDADRPVQQVIADVHTFLSGHRSNGKSNVGDG